MSMFFPKDGTPAQLLPDPGPQGPPGPTGPQGPAGASGASTWDDITGKPSTFAPSAHKTSHAIGGSDALTPADIGALPDAIVVSGAGTQDVNGTYYFYTQLTTGRQNKIWTKDGGNSFPRIDVTGGGLGNWVIKINTPYPGAPTYTSALDSYGANNNPIGLPFEVGSFGSAPAPIVRAAHTHAIADIIGLQSALDTPVATAITSAAAPITAGSVGSAGSIRYDADYIYICTATNTWRRTAITSW